MSKVPVAFSAASIALQLLTTKSTFAGIEPETKTLLKTGSPKTTCSVSEDSTWKSSST